jgi:hypothetical protein
MVRAKTELESWLATAAANPPDSFSAATAQTVGMVSDAVANAVVDALHRNGYHWSGTDHVICTFLAATARTMQQFEDQLDRAVERIVTAVLTSKEPRPSIPKSVAEVAAQAAVNALSKLSAVQNFDDLLRATRILAVTACPAPEHHRAVVRYCLVPLEKEVLSDATTQAITSIS